MMLSVKQIAYVAAVAAMLFVSGCGPTAQPVSPSDKPSSPVTASQSTGPSDAAGQVIDYGPEGVEIRQASDAAKLTGTSHEFKSFIVDLATHPASSSDCQVTAAVITVAKYDPSGFAVGDVFSKCDGYVAFWGKKDGRWKELMGAQAVPLCAEFDKFGIPPAIAGDCTDANGNPGTPAG